MSNTVKSMCFLFFAAAVLILFAQESYSQNGRAGRGTATENISEAPSGTGSPGNEGPGDIDESGDDGFGDESFEDDTEEESGSGLSEKIGMKKEKTGKNAVSDETLLDRETKRHKNQMKQINAMRKRAREMLKKSEDMEAKELKRHDEAVMKIRNE